MSDERLKARQFVLAAVQKGATKAADIKHAKLKAAERTAAIAELVGEGLLAATTKGRTLILALTAAGEEACAALPEAAPTSPAGAEAQPARSATPPASVPRADHSFAALFEYLARIEANLVARLDAIKTRLDALAPLPAETAPEPRPATPEPRPATPEPRPAAAAKDPPSESLKTAILAAVAMLDRKHRHGGMVPIPALRRELRVGGDLSTDEEVNAALLTLEREYSIDLLVAQSPTTVPDRAAGIERPGKGLAYYVAPRTS